MEGVDKIILVLNLVSGTRDAVFISIGKTMESTINITCKEKCSQVGLLPMMRYYGRKFYQNQKRVPEYSELLRVIDSSTKSRYSSQTVCLAIKQAIQEAINERNEVEVESWDTIILDMPNVDMPQFDYYPIMMEEDRVIQEYLNSANCPKGVVALLPYNVPFVNDIDDTRG